ncbi:MAG: glutathione S-transferase family protein [Myxococcales bacterium]|nr:MAG: glutathione S-transferase family protein [Myxococcales bacterium]
MAIEYLEVAEAIERNGLRLVLTTGVPGPWGESAKGIFNVKGLDYVAVRQTAMTVDPALMQWTRQSSAPVAMYDAERPRSGWAEILFLAERLAPDPGLIADDPRERALMLGLCHEICGEHGLGWTRRLMLLAGMPADQPESMPWKYGVSDAVAIERAGDRTSDILSMLERQLADSAGPYLMGSNFRALDIYWACFSNLIEPLAPEQSPMPDFLRAAYGSWNGGCAPSLIALRDRVFEQHLGLPQEY